MEALISQLFKNRALVGAWLKKEVRSVRKRTFMI